MGCYILLLILLSSIIIWKSSDGFDYASSYLGRNLTDGVKGATINAISSSMPELLTSIFFLIYLKDAVGFSGGLGTVAGEIIQCNGYTCTFSNYSCFIRNFKKSTIVLKRLFIEIQ